MDNGNYLNLNLTYFIEIDTTLSFSNPIINSGSIQPIDGLLDWKSPMDYQTEFIFGEQEFIMVKIQAHGVKPEHLK